jgi:predicted HD phosphohydrolase
VFDNVAVLYDDIQSLQGDDIMPALATYPATTPAISSETASITTTLYDLVAALNAEVDTADDALVTAAVVHLINANRARFIGSRKRLAIIDA